MIAFSKDLGTEEMEYALTEPEGSFYFGIRSFKRRSEWLRGRLIAKYMYLSGLKGASYSNAPVEIDEKDLRSIPGRLFKKVEVLRKEGEGMASIDYCGRKTNIYASVTHCGGISAACLSSEENLAGIDVERIESRRDTFIKGNFTSRERSWIDRSVYSDNALRDRMSTILWSVKEAALKSGNRADASVWDFPRMEVQMHEDAVSPAPKASITFFSPFKTFGITVDKEGMLKSASLSISEGMGYVMTVIEDLKDI